MPAQLKSSFETGNSQFTKTIVGEEKIEIYFETKEKVNDSFAEDVEDGLTAKAKYLLPKYLYDMQGSKLFEKITKTEEYYPTRTEKSILNNRVGQIYSTCKNVNVIVELGSGSSEKTKLILNEFLKNNTQIKYIPIDISNIITESSRNLANTFPNLTISGIISDYEAGLSLVQEVSKNPKLVIFLGSSIGNFNFSEINEFLTMIRESLNDDDYLLVGFDMEKDRKVLHAAYNDAQGITRDFNLNILKRVNRELNAAFDLDKFRHTAFFNEKHSRIEMHLVSKEDQKIRIEALDRTIHFRKGETIHTENSYKFSERMIQNFAAQAGLKIVRTWNDPKRYFSLSLFQTL